MLYALLLVTLLSVQPSVVADAAPPSAAAEDPKVTALAKGEFASLQQGKIDRSHYTAKTSAALTDALVTQTGAQISQLGDLKSITLDATQQVQGDTVYLYTLVCANGTLRMTLALTKDGLIDGIYLKPA